MLHQTHRHFEPARAVRMTDDWQRLPFLNAVEKYNRAQSDTEKAKHVEAIIRTSRIVSGDAGLLPDDIQSALIELTRHFRSFGPKEFTAPATYSEARELLQAFFF